MPPTKREYNLTKRCILTTPRSEALKKAQKVHVILINIGKKYRNKEVGKFKLLRSNPKYKPQK